MRGGAGLHRLEHEADGGTWLGASTDGAAAVERIGLLGCRVDSSGLARAATDRTPADAVALYEAVMRLEPRARGLVAQHARHGTAPAWSCTMRLHAVPEHEGRSGKVLVLEDEARVRHCPLTWRGTDQDLAVELARLRSDWRCWRHALDDVWFDVVQRAPENGGVTFTLLQPAAPWQPWEDERPVEAAAPGRSRTVTPELVERAREMYARGKGSWTAIAGELGVSRFALMRALPPATHDLAARAAAGASTACSRRGG